MVKIIQDTELHFINEIQIELQENKNKIQELS